MRNALLALAALALLAPPALALPVTVPPYLGVGSAVSITNFQFTPEVLVVAGSSVTWTNAAPTTTHTATEDNGAWDTGRILPGTSATLTLAAGLYQYHCAIHPGMKGYVLVLGVA
jgi:plastocyanin